MLLAACLFATTAGCSASPEPPPQPLAGAETARIYLSPQASAEAWPPVRSTRAVLELEGPRAELDLTRALSYHGWLTERPTTLSIRGQQVSARSLIELLGAVASQPIAVSASFPDPALTVQLEDVHWFQALEWVVKVVGGHELVVEPGLRVVPSED